MQGVLLTPGQMLRYAQHDILVSKYLTYTIKRWKAEKMLICVACLKRM